MNQSIGKTAASQSHGTQNAFSFCCSAGIASTSSTISTGYSMYPLLSALPNQQYNRNNRKKTTLPKAKTKGRRKSNRQSSARRQQESPRTTINSCFINFCYQRDTERSLPIGEILCRRRNICQRDPHANQQVRKLVLKMDRLYD